MRHRRALLLGLLNVLLTGCVADGAARIAAGLERKPLLQTPTGPDTIVLYVALIERPVGDRYLNQELWTVADEQAVSVERRALLEENGFRIGQVGGIIPAGLLGLLSSERSCVNPRCIQIRSGQPTTVALGSALPECRFEIHSAGQEAAVNLQQARCSFLVRPTLDRDGRTRLQITPQVQHGQALLVPEPTADASGVFNWELHQHRPTECYDSLNWELALGSNEYLLVGARYDRPNTLGQRCFIDREPPNPAQRLLVIRTGHSAEATESASGSAVSEEWLPPTQEAPLALQAFYSAARGYHP